MGFLEEKELSGTEEATALLMARDRVNVRAQPGQVNNMRLILSNALSDSGWYRDTGENGNRVSRLMRAIGDVLEPKTDSAGVAAWVTKANGIDIQHVLAKAARHRQ